MAERVKSLHNHIAKRALLSLTNHNQLDEHNSGVCWTLIQFVYKLIDSNTIYQLATRIFCMLKIYRQFIYKK